MKLIIIELGTLWSGVAPCEGTGRGLKQLNPHRLNTSLRVAPCEGTGRGLKLCPIIPRKGKLSRPVRRHGARIETS